MEKISPKGATKLQYIRSLQIQFVNEKQKTKKNVKGQVTM
jgi:hypothetical protein